MAWNKYYIFVQSPNSRDSAKTLKKLNLEAYSPSTEVPLHHSNKPKTLFCGFYKGNFILVHPDLAFQFFGDTQSEIERRFMDAFPESEIAVLIQNSTVGLYGYAIISQGRKIRMKDGCNEEIFHDEGNLLPEEIELLSQNLLDKEEIEEMYASGMTQEEVDALTHFEASWRTPNLLTKRYLGETIDTIDPSKVRLILHELE